MVKIGFQIHELKKSKQKNNINKKSTKLTNSLVQFLKIVELIIYSLVDRAAFSTDLK